MCSIVMPGAVSTCRSGASERQRRTCGPGCPLGSPGTQVLAACLSGHRSMINGNAHWPRLSPQTTNTFEAVCVLTAVSVWPGQPLAASGSGPAWNGSAAEGTVVAVEGRGGQSAVWSRAWRTAAAIDAPAAWRGSGSRRAWASTKAPSRAAIIARVRRRVVGSPRPCRAKRIAPREIQSVKTSAVACRRWSLVLATSRVWGTPIGAGLAWIPG